MLYLLIAFLEQCDAQPQGGVHHRADSTCECVCVCVCVCVILSQDQPRLYLAAVQPCVCSSLTSELAVVLRKRVLTIAGGDDLEQHGRSPSLGQLPLPHLELCHLLVVQLPGSANPHM